MQIFHRSTNFLSRVSIFGAVFFIAILLWLFYDLEASPYTTQQNTTREQPVQFSHAHHVGAIGIDCRYCHTSVEKAAFAGIPPTKTCMNCHSQIWAQSPYLEPVRASFRDDKSIEWTRVNDLPDFVYFDHSIHVKKGVACQTCHGPVETMGRVTQEAPLTMEWCLDCHRRSWPKAREKADVALLNLPKEDAYPPGTAPMTRANRLTDCAVCHH
jgi:hypothetical protein